MSEENVEVARGWFWAFENDTDAFRDILHPEIEWFPFEENHTPSHGIGGAMRIRNQWLDTWSDIRINLTQMVDRGEHVVATGHVTARGKGSGVEVDAWLHFHFKVRDGKIAYIYEYEDRAEALEAAGLSE
jgi:ketosteroid isomerase-like protein